MRSSRLFRRVVAGLCAAAMLCGGMAASAAAPALPAAPAAVEATNAAPSDAELKAAFSKFTVTYDEEAGGYDQDLGCWFDMELFQLSDEEVSLLSEWLNAKSVTAVFVGRDGTSQSYALTKENRTAIQEMVTAYNLMLSSTVEQCEPILTSLAK